MNFKKTILHLFTFLFVLSTIYVYAGEVEPPSGVDQDSSTMFTIDDLYNRLNGGTVGDKRSGADGFQEPDTEPASSTDRKTLNDVMGKMPAADNTDGAIKPDVVGGKTFWGLRTDGTWGQMTGTGYDLCRVYESRWQDHLNGTVTDLKTGLMWTKNADHGQKSWSGAHTYIDTLNSANHLGYSDWRLPTVAMDGGTAELETLGHANGGTTGGWTEPGTPFTDVVVTTITYWSGTTCVHNTGTAWNVAMRNGDIYSYGKGASCYVWPVRGGQ